METRSSAKRKRAEENNSQTPLTKKRRSRRAQLSTPSALTVEAVKSLPRKSKNRVDSWLHTKPDTMAPRSTKSRGSAQNLESSSSRTKSVETSGTKSDKTSRTSVPTIYDPEIPSILYNADIYGPRDSQNPRDMEEIQARLRKYRRSCSPSQVPNLGAMFKQVEAAVNDADNEDQYKQTVILPHFFQGTNTGEEGYDSSFSALDPMTLPSDPKIPPPKPDYFLGEHYRALPIPIYRNLSGKIKPTHRPTPVLVNQTLEIKGPGGKYNTGIIQATHSTAASTRAMNALDLYCNPNARVHEVGRSSALIFSDGFMQVFIGYSKKPLEPGGPTRYYTVRCGGECFVGSPEQLLNAKRLWRNSAEWTQELRKNAVKGAIARYERSQNMGSQIPQKRANHGVDEDEEDKQDDDENDEEEGEQSDQGNGGEE